MQLTKYHIAPPPIHPLLPRKEYFSKKNSLNRAFIEKKKLNPREMMTELNLPEILVEYLLFSDLDVERVIQAYSQTWKSIHDITSSL